MKKRELAEYAERARDEMIKRIEIQMTKEVREQLPTPDIQPKEMKDPMGLVERQDPNQSNPSFSSFQEVRDGKLVFQDPNTLEEKSVSYRQMPLLESTKGKFHALEFLRQIETKELIKTVALGVRTAEKNCGSIGIELFGRLWQKVVDANRSF
ncbi:hypothetical protein SAMN05444392_10870 [Seinonella peptonophila]|uniref:Uncharacterized protein n=1 Tax=Seinonella peptonophila TaxID=112248 RepID=A0A1M4Z7V6_9BACL|nr:hypothetical protein [Seinonella peptonophila]SHF13676.1 hypothetical protein SAMN05444392_10870 [Seinonella peptonophila]